ncbi:MAG: hypothetical protein E6J34_15505 [Chloroflexi bacterium]|nr:MAG: hypothetical protein E6J34_15505 [Chloroflexota bacterium]
MAVHSITTERSLEQLVMDCQEGVQWLARKYVQWMKHTDFDDLVQVAMEAIVRYTQKSGTDCPIQYYLQVAKCAILNYWRDGHDDILSRDRRGPDLSGVVSLDAPLGPESDACLLDFLVDQPVVDVVGEHVKVVEQSLEKLLPCERKGLGVRFGLTGYGESHGKERNGGGMSKGMRKLRTILSAPLKAQPANKPVSKNLPLVQRCCLVCHKDLKHRVPGAVYELHSQTRFVCRVCNSLNKIDQLGHAMALPALDYRPGATQYQGLMQKFGFVAVGVQA